MIKQLMDILNLEEVVHNEYACRTYAVLDGVKFPMLWSELEDGVLSYDMLFCEEALRNKLEKVAPFLVQLDFDNKTGLEQTKTLLSCYGKNGCIFLSTPLRFEQTLERMREIFYLYDEEGIVDGVLRFYEPAIFHELLHEPSNEVQRDIFAQINCYWCEESSGYALRQYMWDTAYVRYKTISLN